MKENNKVIGTVGIEKYGLEDALTEFKDYYGRELGYVLSKDYWGNGLVPEAVNAVIDYLFNELDYDFLLCGYYNFNERSKRVQEKCGFVWHHTRKDVCCELMGDIRTEQISCLTRNDWLSQSKA